MSSVWAAGAAEAGGVGVDWGSANPAFEAISTLDTAPSNATLIILVRRNFMRTPFERCERVGTAAHRARPKYTEKDETSRYDIRRGLARKVRFWAFGGLMGVN